MNLYIRLEHRESGEVAIYKYEMPHPESPLMCNYHCVIPKNWADRKVMRDELHLSHDYVAKDTGQFKVSSLSEEEYEQEAFLHGV